MKKGKISFFSLLMISSALVVSIRNLPTISEMGLKMIFFGLISAICFFIPIALSSAELATGWPKLGGVYAWVKVALGEKWGMFASWLQWSYMTISVIAMVYFIAGSLAFVFAPHFASNRLFLAIVSLTIIWLFTYLNLKGIKATSLISTLGFLAGVLFPGLLIITLAIIYLVQGNPVELDLSLTKENLIPNLDSLPTLVLLIGFMRAFAGIEASSSHANLVKNPRKNFPLVILLVVIFGLTINIIGSLSVAIVVSKDKISLIAGIMEAFTVFFGKFHIAWVVPIMAILVAAGQIGGVSTWLIGPVKGLLATARDGSLPPFFSKVNKHDVPVRLLILQGFIISVITLVLLRFPSINIAFWISVALSMMIYVSMYFLMLLSTLVLRYKMPEVKRSYRIPFGKMGVWIVTGIGMLTMIFAFIIAIFPPAELPSKNHVLYISFLLISITIYLVLPFIIYRFKKPSWKENVKKRY